MTDTELRRLAENATKGPWEAAYDGAYPTGTVLGGDGIIASCDTDPGIAEQCMNAIYIAAASPDVVLGLLDRIKALEVERDEAMKVVRYQDEALREVQRKFHMELIPHHAAKGGE